MKSKHGCTQVPVRLQTTDHAPVLAGASSLLLVEVIKLGIGGDRLAVVHLRRAYDDAQSIPTLHKTTCYFHFHFHFVIFIFMLFSFVIFIFIFRSTISRDSKSNAESGRWG